MTDTTTLEDKLKAKFGNALTRTTKDYDFQVYEFQKSEIKNAIDYLKNQEGFIYLTTLCGVHFPDAEKDREFSMMYQLHNLVTNERIRLKTFMPREDLQSPSIVGVYDSANWMEREAFDFFGFTFEGHPNLKRILNMEEMNYHPMRKEYPLEDLSRDDKDDKFFGRD
jgi:NADH-quinone oxidoreductase subunit C